MVGRMTRFLFPLLAIAASLTAASAAQAACQAEYKAKRDTPFELYYDTARISGPCTKANAQAQLQAMLAAQGLTLLKVLSVTEN